MRHDQHRPVEVPDDVRRGEGLSRTSHAEEGLVTVSREDRAGQLVDRLRLIPLRCVVGAKLERHGGDGRV